MVMMIIVAPVPRVCVARMYFFFVWSMQSTKRGKDAVKAAHYYVTSVHYIGA